MHARINYVSIHTRARDLEDLNIDLEFMGLSLSQGFFIIHFTGTGFRMVAEHRVVCAELERSDEPQGGQCDVLLSSACVPGSLEKLVEESK